MNKKGDVISIITIVIFLFLVAAVSLLFSNVFLQTLDELKTQESFSNTTIQTIEKVESKTIPYLDYFFLFAFIAFFIGVVISSIYVSSHPAFVPIYIIILIIAILIAGILANSYVEITNQPELTTTAAQFSFTEKLMNIFPLLTLLMGVVSIVILYGKGKGGGQVALE